MDQVRSKFLAEASQQLFATGSTTSAHLSAERNGLHSGLRDSSKGTDFSSCRACGTIWVPGLSMELKTTLPVTQGKRSTPGVSSTRTTITTVSCNACGRVARHVQLYERKSRSTRRTQQAASAIPPIAPDHATTVEEVTEQSATGTPRSTPSESKLSSKQRAKARKDRSGLQALLKGSKESNPSAPKLSFMSLMKQ
jgi:hypothetical protein